MIPFKPNKDESRRSSILKPCKPRQPLQNINFTSSSNENSPATSKINRRVCFAEKKHVKEFCDSIEQGTVWDNTYEEHDSSLKGSFVTDQSTTVPVIVQNCKDAKCSISNNNMVLSTNLQSTKNVVSSQIHDANCSRSHVAQDSSMKLTSVVQSLVVDADILNMNNDGNDASFNSSMEMTTALSSKIYERNTTCSCNKSTNKGNNLRKSLESTEHTNKTEIFNNVPMEITRPVNLYGRNVPHFSENIEENLRQNRETNNSGEIELFSNTPIQMMRSINVMLPASVYDEENLRIDEPMFRDDRNTSLYMSMEITKAVSPRNREEILNPIKNECEEKSTNNLMTSNEKTKLLCKFMDITEALPDSLLHEKTCNIENTGKLTEAMISDTVITPRIHLPGENFAGSVLQTYSALNNDEPINASMEITTAIQPIIHDMENVTFNGMKHLDVSKSSESQCPIINNVTESKKNETKENITIPGEIVETTNLQNASSDTHVLIDNYNNLSDVILTNSNRKRSTCENENISIKKFCSDSFAESELSICNNTHSSFRIDDEYISNKRSIKDKTDPTRISTLSCKSNSSDSLNKIDKCSFLRKNLENSLVELQSINPPSFVDISSDEENSFPEVVQENKLDTSIITDSVLINNNSYERLEPMNIENEKIKDCHKSVVTDTIKNDRRTDRQAIERTIIDDFQTDKSNCHTTDVEQLKGEDVLSASNVRYGKTMTLSGTDHFIEINITREDQVDEEEYTQEEINNKVEVRNIEQKKQCSEIEEEKECYINRLKKTIKDQVNKIKNQDEYCQENLDDKVNLQGVEQKEDCVEQRSGAEQDVNRIKEAGSLVDQDPFLSLSQKLEEYAEREDCIWNVYYKNVNRKMIAFGFMSNSLLIVTFLSDSLNYSEENLIKEVKIISRLADDADVLINIVHGLILEKINVETLTHLYKTHEDILAMLEFVSRDVKLAMNFMFDLKRLDNLNLMEIARDEISFLSWSKHMDIILKITINVKRFDKLTPNDINIRCLLGTIKETEVKNLIKNVKKNHRFLRRYMNDVKDYIDIMEQISTTLNRPY